MESKRTESNNRDQETLTIFQESRKRPRSGCSSPLSDCPLDSLQIKKEKIDEASWKPAESVWLEDPAGLYKIKREFLRILGIEPPITNWIVVENFRCDKAELLEILELAGYVVMCSVIYGRQKHAKVMYSHPLEAVQAVSMFNKQIYYGSALKVTMFKYPLTNVILPKGLQNLGPGFGIYGKPLKDVVKHFERFVRNEPNMINSCLFHDPNEVDAPSSVETIDSDNSKDDINEKFQFKQFVIRNVEDVNEDSKSETDSKKDNSENKGGSKTTSLPKYSPRSPTRSLTMTDEYLSNTRSVSPESRLQTLQNSKPSNSLGYGDKINLNASKYPINSSGTIMRPCGGPIGPRPVPAPSYRNNNLLLTPNHGSMNPNPMTSVGPRFGPNPMAGPTFGPNAPGINAIPGPRFGPTNPMVRPNAAPVAMEPRIRPVAPVGPVSNVVPGFNGPTMRPSGPEAGPNSSGFVPAPPTTVQFRNLPPTTTFPLLCEKMAQCGQVMSIQLTTPGCANVVFSHPAHAQNCFQRYNNIMVDGCIVEARIV